MNVFRDLLNKVTELELLVEFGREFHILGPATENALSPDFLVVRGIYKLPCESKLLFVALVSNELEMYVGKVPDIHLNMFKANLNIIRFSTGSQCSCLISGEVGTWFG